MNEQKGMSRVKKKISVFAFTAILIVAFAAGCSQSEEKEEHDNHKGTGVLQVEIEIDASPAKVKENVIFEAKVTQGGEPVEDAKEVEFEFVREGEETSETIEVLDQRNGIYRLEKSFTDEGTYTITTHVTARDMHAMPSKEFEITP